jgi:hypothetical protein
MMTFSEDDPGNHAGTLKGNSEEILFNCFIFKDVMLSGFTQILA